MSKKDPFLELSDQFDQVLAERNKLLTENAELREAATHFLHCRTCAEDGTNFCFVGRRLDDFLSSLDEKEAV